MIKNKQTFFEWNDLTLQNVTIISELIAIEQTNPLKKHILIELILSLINLQQCT